MWKSRSKSGSSAHDGGPSPAGAATTRWRSRGIATTALAIRRLNRSTSGAWSSRVTRLNAERMMGSRSTSHITASVSLIRRSMRSGRAVCSAMAVKLPTLSGVKRW